MERRLDDPSNKTGTLLTLPLSDFPNNKTKDKSSTATSQQPNNSRDDDDLILISLPHTKDDSGITMEDLIRGKSVYILGDTSEKDMPNSSILPPEQHPEQPNKEGVGGSIEPIAARLIVEGKSTGKSGKTMELTRVETSNTYIVVPPMISTEEENDSNKRQKLSADSSSAAAAKGKKELVTMPARSIGLLPGEDSPSCFFLDPLHLQPGHFASKLRGSLSRWMYDPFDPPVVSNEGKEEAKFGYTIQELAHICRTSQSEIEYAIHNRVYGAEDALVIPSSSDESSSTNRYGMLSEEGRQTVATAIVTTLLESDLDLVWMEQKTPRGMKLSLLMDEIREHWHRLEGGDNAESSQPQMETEEPLAESQSQNNYSQSQWSTTSYHAEHTNSSIGN